MKKELFRQYLNPDYTPELKEKPKFELLELCLYEIIDNQGIAIGMPKTQTEAERLLKRLNMNGEHRPYTLTKVWI